MNCLMLLGTGVITYSMDARIYPMQIFFHVGISLLFLMLGAGVAAQHTFGGCERFVAWREAGVSVSMVRLFVGRDLASLTEVGLLTTTFTMVYWYLGPLFVTYGTLFWTTFAFVYAV